MSQSSLMNGSNADIMKRIKKCLEVFWASSYADCGERMTNALKYGIGELPAMQRDLEYGDMELSNNLNEPIMRSIDMNCKNDVNIGSEESAGHNAFMFSIIEA